MFGESAGAVSIGLLMASSQTKGLFHAAIMQSGVANSNWFRSDKHPAFHARQ